MTIPHNSSDTAQPQRKSNCKCNERRKYVRGRRAMEKLNSITFTATLSCFYKKQISHLVRCYMLDGFGEGLAAKS